MKKRSIVGSAAALILGILACAGSAGALRDGSPLPQPLGLGAPETVAASESQVPDVPFVPTPEEVVDRMLEMAQVGKEDMVYDLGCGDGRIVITAAKQRGARGLGIDISPDRIRESQLNAQKAKVADRVQFLQQDLFTSDFSQASVVTLYLLPTVNLKLRPKLLSELKPGTRIVSHAFDMGSWKPDQSDSINGRDIFFWVVPANVSGTWEWQGADFRGGGVQTLELKQSFQHVEGTMVADGRALVISDAKLVGERLEFSVQPSGAGAVRYTARVQGDSMQGGSMSAGAANWQARRNPATMTPLDSTIALNTAESR